MNKTLITVALIAASLFAGPVAATESTGLTGTFDPDTFALYIVEGVMFSLTTRQNNKCNGDLYIAEVDVEVDPKKWDSAAMCWGANSTHVIIPMGDSIKPVFIPINKLTDMEGTLLFPNGSPSAMEGIAT